MSGTTGRSRVWCKDCKTSYIYSQGHECRVFQEPTVIQEGRSRIQTQAQMQEDLFISPEEDAELLDRHPLSE